MYVTALERKKGLAGADYTSRTFAVRAPDLILSIEDEDGRTIVKHLTV